MILAVTDANIFIDLYELDLLPLLFELDLTLYTTKEVLLEGDENQRLQLQLFINNRKLTIYTISEIDVLEIERMEKNKELLVQRSFPITDGTEYKDSEVKGFVLIIMGVILLSLLWDTTSQPMVLVKMIAMGVAFLIGMYD